jgi:hypothetical protein
MRHASEHKRASHLRFNLQSTKPEKLLKLWREFHLRAGRRERLLVRGFATRLFYCWRGSRLPLSRMFNQSNCNPAQSAFGHFYFPQLRYDIAAYARGR